MSRLHRFGRHRLQSEGGIPQFGPQILLTVNGQILASMAVYFSRQLHRLASDSFLLCRF